jgi:SAM-dependent methyltransferase
MPAGTGEAAAPYALQGHDAVRSSFESAWFARVIPRLLREAGGGELVDLGCGDGAAARLAGDRLTRYVGVDLAPTRSGRGELEFLSHDLRAGLGPVGRRPFDLYLGTFGIASHLAPAELRRLLADIAAHARPGAIVALEALGLFSLEWPRLWAVRTGPGRAIPYRLAGEVTVHPWAPAELFGLFREAGIEPVGAHDRTLQAGPKTGDGRYWPGLPRLREAVNTLLAGGPAGDAAAQLAAPLPPLPAGEPALVHHTLAARRRALARRRELSAASVWSLEPETGGGFGHGLLVVGRVRRARRAAARGAPRAARAAPRRPADGSPRRPAEWAAPPAGSAPPPPP